MTPEGLAQTHAAAFEGKGWSVADFAQYLTDPKILIHGEDTCFAVFRHVGPEAEILSLATHPDVQGQGRATHMMRTALDVLKSANVEDVFLDVAEDNAPARALYARFGFMTFARRNNYYANGVSAICMKLVLSYGLNT